MHPLSLIRFRLVSHDATLLRRSPGSVGFDVLKRYRHKKKWASKFPEKTPKDHALSYFDSFYKPVYGRLWPSMRVALLSQQKYSALLNNFCDTEDVIVDLITNGADDITKVAREKELESDGSGSDGNTLRDGHVLEERQAIAEMKQDMGDSLQSEERPQESDANVVGSASLYDFVPAQRIVSEKEELKKQEIQQGFYSGEEDQLNVNCIQSGPLQIPAHLQVFAKPRGDISLFPPPSTNTSGRLAYYLYDAASLLPVLALDLAPGDSVLDLCAAPGGKSLTMLQTMLPGGLVCVDHSHSRLKRLKDVMRWYLPRSYTEEKRVETIHADGIHFCQRMHGEAQYDKVLVDVPCYTDRHVLLEDENNIFRPARQKERLMIQDNQKNLLVGALKLLRPGGQAVYSTCTLAAPQNDGIIQAALEELWNTTNISFAIMDASEIAHRFSDTFNFYQHCRYGQLVLPNLTANFGPMYFCKIQRTS